MIYRVYANMYFDLEDEAKDFFHDCELALPKSTVVNPGQPDQLVSEAWRENCYHDEHPSQPCLIVEHITNDPNPL